MKRDLAFYKTASDNLYKIYHIKLFVDRLKKTGPEILFFHGISLLGNVYPTMGERSLIDVDILVRGRDLGRLKKVLQELGMQEGEPGVFIKMKFVLDIHTSFLTPIRTTLANSCLTITMDDVFNRSIAKQLDDVEIMIPCPEQLFISTALHLQSHAFSWNKGWEDLKRIKQYYNLSNEKLLSETAMMGTERTLYYLTYLRPTLFPAWKKKLTFRERLILNRIKRGAKNENLGDLLFLFQSKRKLKALAVIFFPKGFSLRIIGDRLQKSLRLVRDIVPRLQL